MKFGEWLDYGPETNRLNFGNDQAHILDVHVAHCVICPLAHAVFTTSQHETL